MLDRLRGWLLGPRPQPESLPDVTLRPIGLVRNRIKEPVMFGWADVDSDIILRPELAAALLGLDAYSHIIVLFWMHGVPAAVRGSKLRLHPLDDPRYPVQGILATRSQIRPNPVGLAVVPLRGRRGNRLRVRGLDAIDGTPVLDIKPYVPYYDAVPEASIPQWAQEVTERLKAIRKP